MVGPFRKAPPGGQESYFTIPKQQKHSHRQDPKVPKACPEEDPTTVFRRAEVGVFNSLGSRRRAGDALQLAKRPADPLHAQNEERPS